MSLCRLLLAWLALSLLGAALLFCLGGCAGEVRVITPRAPGVPAPGPIREGDRVRLRSGGPLMLVARVDCRRRECRCEWFGVVGPRAAWFRMDLLQKE